MMAKKASKKRASEPPITDLVAVVPMEVFDVQHVKINNTHSDPAFQMLVRCVEEVMVMGKRVEMLLAKAEVRADATVFEAMQAFVGGTKERARFAKDLLEFHDTNEIGPPVGRIIDIYYDVKAKYKITFGLKDRVLKKASGNGDYEDLQEVAARKKFKRPAASANSYEWLPQSGRIFHVESLWINMKVPPTGAPPVFHSFSVKTTYGNLYACSP